MTDSDLLFILRMANVNVAKNDVSVREDGLFIKVRNSEINLLDNISRDYFGFTEEEQKKIETVLEFHFGYPYSRAQKLKEIVSNKLVYYRSDYHFDIKAFREKGLFVWIVYDSGTHFSKIEELSTFGAYKSFLDYKNASYYLVDTAKDPIDVKPINDKLQFYKDATGKGI